MFKYTLDNKRYHTLNYYLKNKFNDKVIKISLNGNFTCTFKILFKFIEKYINFAWFSDFTMLKY